MNRKEIAEYVVEIATTLARLTQAAQMQDLAYLLSLAAHEAANTASEMQDRGARVRRPQVPYR